MTTRSLRIAFRITKATNAHSRYVILIADPLPQWLQEHVSVLGSMYGACLVSVVRMIMMETIIHFFIILCSTHDSCDREGFFEFVM